jgi:hypothetical protein
LKLGVVKEGNPLVEAEVAYLKETILEEHQQLVEGEMCQETKQHEESVAHRQMYLLGLWVEEPTVTEY